MDQVLELGPVDAVELVRRDDLDICHEERRLKARTGNAVLDAPVDRFCALCLLERDGGLLGIARIGFEPEAQDYGSTTSTNEAKSLPSPSAGC